MTAHTPPTPPAMRDRKLESVCFEASTTSVLISSAEGMEAGEDDEEEEDIVHATNRKKDNQWKEWRGMGSCCCDGIAELELRAASRGTICQACLFSEKPSASVSPLPPYPKYSLRAPHSYLVGQKIPFLHFQLWSLF